MKDSSRFYKLFAWMVFSALLTFAAPLRAQDAPATSAITAFLTKNLEALISSLGSWGISTVEFGQNDGMIFKGVVSIGRTVERNENVQRPDDKFLVKDELKIGVRLGVGAWVSGDVSFVRKYTLIYPAKSRLQAAFKNKFIVNLVLPYQVHAQKLPDQYVLLIEDSIEGRGRLKIGADLMIPIGIEGSASAIKLTRLFTAKQDADHMVFLDDQENMFKLSYQVYAHLLFLELPFAESYLARGKNKRQMLHVNLKKVSEQRFHTAFRHFIKNGALKDFESIGEYKELSGTFREAHHKFELPWLLEWLKISRRDRFHLDDANNPEVSGDYMSLFSYHKRYWWLPLSGETHWEQVTLTMREHAKEKRLLPNGKMATISDYRPAMAHITMRVRDQRTTQNEMVEKYLPVIKRTASDPNFIHLPEVPSDGHSHWGKTSMWFDLFLFEDSLAKLETLKADEYWRLVAKATDNPEFASTEIVNIIAKNKFQYRKRWRIIRPFWKAWKDITRAQKKEELGQESRQALWLNRALLTLVRKGRAEHRPLYMRWLRHLAESASEQPDYLLHARIVVPDDRLSKANDGVILQNTEGNDRRAESFRTPFVFFDMQQMWAMFLPQ